LENVITIGNFIVFMESLKNKTKMEGDILFVFGNLQIKPSCEDFLLKRVTRVNEIFFYNLFFSVFYL
jgi:hypothetical protein